MTIKIVENILLYFFRDRDHIRKDRSAAVKAVVIDADQMILLSQPIQHCAEVRLIVACCSGKQHQGLSGFITHLIKLHVFSSNISAWLSFFLTDQSQELFLFQAHALYPGSHPNYFIKYC